MIIISILLILISNAVSAPLRKEPIRDISVIFNRIAIITLIFCILQEMISLFIINDDIGLHGGLLYTTNITQTFHMFILIISILILQLTSFYSNSSTIQEYTKAGQHSRPALFKNVNMGLNSLDGMRLATGKRFMSTLTSLTSTSTSHLNLTHNKVNSIMGIKEYPLIILFVITGAIFLISTNDLVSIFLSIELQSYGLYILSTIYRNSELSTTGGLIYFLLGGLSSCFILLGIALIYANSGNTGLDGLYIITGISDLSVAFA
jgi:NADH-ubiquinone oxidoreductase chain 2